MEYDFEKLAREIVTSRLQEIESAPEVCGEIARKIIVAAVRGTKVRQEPRATVAAVCRGVMGGMLLLGKDLPRTAVCVLQQMAEISHELQFDPSDLMTWGMEGLAGVLPMAGPQAEHAVEEAVERAFMGAGETFRRVRDRARAKG